MNIAINRDDITMAAGHHRQNLRVAALAWDHNAYYHRLILQQLPRPCGQVLDVGCGAGQLAAKLAARADHVDALDRSPVMIELARRTHDVRKQAQALLPGATVRRLVFWRYFLLWRKP